MTEQEARECWDDIEQYMEAECGHCPDYLNEAERVNVANIIYNWSRRPKRRWWQLFWKRDKD